METSIPYGMLAEHLELLEHVIYEIIKYVFHIISPGDKPFFFAGLTDICRKPIDKLGLINFVLHSELLNVRVAYLFLESMAKFDYSPLMDVVFFFFFVICCFIDFKL